MTDTDFESELDVAHIQIPDGYAGLIANKDGFALVLPDVEVTESLPVTQILLCAFYLRSLEDVAWADDLVDWFYATKENTVKITH